VKPRSVAAACALAVWLSALSASTLADQVRVASPEGAVSRFQLEQMLVYLRARGRVVAPPSIDGYIPRIKIPVVNALLDRTSGNDIASPQLSANDQLMERAIVTVYKSLLSGGGGCCPCAGAATCNDGLFCNGTETCTANNCSAGSPPCNDGNPCTIDSCTENTDSCSFTPVPPPAEVAQLNVNRAAPLSTVASLSWSGVIGANSYNIYRGASRSLGDLSCFQSGVLGTSQNDDGVRPANAFYYLVSSVACGVSTLGSGNPTRPAPPACP
jgi:hypothetical protein